MHRRIYHILQKILGKPKGGNFEHGCFQYQFNCPCCADENGGIRDGKYNLEVNLKLFKYHCWKCGDTNGMKGGVFGLIKKYGTYDDLNNATEAVSYMVKSRMYDINLFKSGLNGDESDRDADYVTLPSSYQRIDLSTNTNRTLVKYLESRRITQAIIDKFRIGYTDWSETSVSMRNRLIIPSYGEDGELNYWVGRSFSDTKSKYVFKYKNCTRNKMGVVFQESLINWDFDIVLCEGAIDCLYVPNAISMLGKTLSVKSELYRKIMERACGDVIISLDADTTPEETASIYKKLNNGRLSGRVWFTEMGKYKDFGEAYENEGNRGIIRILRTKKKYDIINKLKYRIYD